AFVALFPELTPAVSTPLLGKNTAENTELHPLSMDRGISLTGQSPRKSHQSQLAACKCYFGGHKSHQCDGRFAATFERRCNFRRFPTFRNYAMSWIASSKCEWHSARKKWPPGY